MATYLITLPVVVTRTVAIVGPDPVKAAEAIIHNGAPGTDLMPHVDQVLAFYSNANNGVPYSWQEVDGETKTATIEKPPEGTVIQ